MSVRYLVVDSEWNKNNSPDLIGKIFDEPPSYTAVKQIKDKIPIADIFRMQSHFSLEPTAETSIDDFVIKCVREGYEKDEVVEGIREFYRQAPEVGNNIFDRAVMNFMGIGRKMKMFNLKNAQKVDWWEKRQKELDDKQREIQETFKNKKPLQEKMIPGQTPYTDDERKKLHKMVGDAAEGDPGEKNEETEKEKNAFINSVKTIEASLKNKYLQELKESIRKDLVRQKIKTAKGEVELIDGKWYNENLEEVPNPNVAKSIEFNIKGEVVVLKEGEQYKNYFGNYLLKVISNPNDPQNAKVTVEYLDGQFKNQEKVYPAKSQAEAIYSEKNRVRIEEEERQGIDIIEFRAPDEFFTLGYLAKHSRIIVEVPKDLTLKFETKYKELTGDDAQRYLKNGSYYIAPKQESRWYIRGRLVFDLNETAASRVSFPNDVNINNKNGRIEINNNNYIYNLFKRGFRLGRNDSNYNSLSVGLSGQSKEAFDQGFNS